MFNTANPTFAGTVAGAVGSDTFTETFTTAATTASNVGSYPIVPAVTGADLANYSVSAVNGALTITGAPTTTTVAVPATATAGASVSLSATVSSTAGTPGGTVTFSSGSTALGTGTLAAGVATLSTTALAAGTDTITATYAAAGNFTGSNGTANLSVSAAPGAPAGTYSIAANPGSLTVQAGATGSTMLTLTPTGGYTGTVTFSCTNLPSGASCSFAQSPVTLKGNNQSMSVGLTISTASQAAKGGTPSPAVPGLLALAFWWPGGLTGLAVFARKRTSKMPRSLQLCLLLLCLAGFAVGLSGCGGGGMNSTTGPTISQVTVTASGTSGAAISNQSVGLTLTVTP